MRHRSRLHDGSAPQSIGIERRGFWTSIPDAMRWVDSLTAVLRLGLEMPCFDSESDKLVKKFAKFVGRQGHTDAGKTLGWAGPTRPQIATLHKKGPQRALEKIGVRRQAARLSISG